MGKIGSSIIFGIILTIIVGLNLPYDANLILLVLAFAIGVIVGTISFVTKIYDSVIESPAHLNIGTGKRIFSGIILSLFGGFFFGVLSQNAKWMILSLPFIFMIGYSVWGSHQLSRFWSYTKKERAKNMAERDRLRTIEREEYAKEKGRVKAHGGHRQSDRPIHIHVGSRARSSGDGLKSPQELTEGYKASKRRAEQHYKDTERDMKKKIWG